MITEEILKSQIPDEAWRRYREEYHYAWEEHCDYRDQVWEDTGTEDLDKLMAADEATWKKFRRKERYLINKYYKKYVLTPSYTTPASSVRPR